MPLLLLANRDSFSRSSIEHAARARGVDLSVKLESASAPALAALAEHGVGIAILPDAVVPDRFRGLLLPVEPGDALLRREVWLTWRRGSQLSAAALAFVEAARAAATAGWPAR